MKEFFLIIVLALYPIIGFTQSLDAQKLNAKNENLNTFYENVFIRKYPMEKIVKALLGIEGDPVEIKNYYLELQSQKRKKSDEIDSANSEEAVKSILGSVKEK